MEANFYSWGAASMKVQLDVDRYYGPTESGHMPQAPYLLTLHIPPSVHGHLGSYPQARAVMDDFGDLRIVRGWM